MILMTGRLLFRKSETRAMDVRPKGIWAFEYFRLLFSSIACKMRLLLGLHLVNLVENFMKGSLGKNFDIGATG